MSQQVSSASTARDTSKASTPDSLEQIFIPSMGSASFRADSNSMLHSTRFIALDALTPTGLLSHYTTLFFREIGSPGQTTETVAQGNDTRSVSFLLDGRPMNDPINGQLSLEKIPLEYVDEIEILSGALSSFWAANGVGSSLNFVSHQYNTPRPLTKFKFHQGSFEHIVTDVLFSQNVARGLNAMVGIQRQVTDGRFPNSKYDSWNLRTRLRYNPSRKLNLWFSDLYNKHTTGLNHGIDRKKNTFLYDELTSTVVNSTASENSTERDLTLNALARAFDDSTWITRGSLYYSVKEREYHDPMLSMKKFVHSNYWGGQLDQQFKKSFLTAAIGFDVQQRNVTESNIFESIRETYTAFKAKIDLFPDEAQSIHAFGRYEHLRSESYFSWGGELSSQIAEQLTATAGYSRALRLPTIFERYAIDSLVILQKPLNPEMHSAFNLKLRWTISPSLRATLTAFDRTIHDAIFYQALPRDSFPSTLLIKSSNSIHHFGVDLEFLIHFWKFDLVLLGSYLTTQQNEVNAILIPRYRVRGELTYSEIFFNGALDGKIGIRGLAISKHQSYAFLPHFDFYAALPSLTMNPLSTFDLFAAAKLGDAYLTFVMENPLNINTMVTPYYPMPGRTIRFGVNWKFLD
ncbi:MAG: putative porin [bacterium]